MSSTRQAAFLALAAVTGCSAESEVVLTVAGDVPGAVVLFARVVNDQGSPERVYSAGDADKPVTLPATIYLRLKSKRVGAVVWLADAGGNIVAQGYTEQCAELAASGRYTIMLSPAPDGWSPSFADRCRCDPADPLGPMCPATPGDGGPPPADAGEDAQPAVDAGAEVLVMPDAPLTVDAAPDAAAAVDAAMDAAAPDARDAAADTRDSAPDRTPDLGGPDMSSSAAPSALFGFEMTAPDWTSTDTQLMRDTAVHTEGAASLLFTTPGSTTIRSRSFATKDLGAMGTKMSVDLFVNEKQVGDANTEMWVDCESANVFGVYMGYKALAALKAPAWTTLSYNMPASVKQALSGDFTDCQVWFQLVGKGVFRYDRMAFVP